MRICVIPSTGFFFSEAHVGHHRWNLTISLAVEWSSIAFTSRSPGRPGCFHLSREHRKRLQQPKVGSVLLSLVEISNNRFGVDVMMCGPPVGWKSSSVGAFWWVTESWIYCLVQ